MELMDKYFEKVIKGKVVVELGCAGFSTEYSGRAKILNKHSKEWFGGDIDKEFLKAKSDNKNLFYCDLNDLDFFDKFPKDVDVITLIEVIEHLKSPFSTIKYICENKSPKTELLVSVPNGMSFGRALYGFTNTEKLLKQDLCHYYTFNEKTLNNIFTDAGLSKFEIIPYTGTELMKSILRFIPNFASGFLIHGK